MRHKKAIVSLLLICTFAVFAVSCDEQSPTAPYEEPGGYDEIQPISEEPGKPDTTEEPADTPAEQNKPENEFAYIDEIMARSDTWNPIHFENVRTMLSPDTPYGKISMSHLIFMNDILFSRTAFSKRELGAAVWIAEELLAIGYSWDEIQVQEFSWEEVSQWSWQTEEALGFESGRTSQNIILTVPGQSEQSIVIGAHYDSTPNPGANDNASGTALLLESAQRMFAQDHEYTLVYVFFGAEEVGQTGAHYYWASLSEEQRENILFMFNADSLLGTHLFYAAGINDDGNPADDSVSLRIHEIASDLSAAYDAEFFSRPTFINGNSDQQVFANEGITVVCFLGVCLDENGEYINYFPHSDKDDIYYTNEIIPGAPDSALRFYSIFLEGILLARY